jgi:two-component system chemotaxis response regulator CheB
MIRVLVVDDSPTVRNRLIEILGSDPEFHVVGNAADGREAIELCAKLRPDVITLDLALPEIDGLGVTEHVMAVVPTPILIVSASFNRGEVFNTYQALGAGAVDVLEKPREGDEAWEARFLAAVRMVSRIKVITHPRARLKSLSRPLPLVPPAAIRAKVRPCELLAIGASTGGPSAILDVLSGLPQPYHLPIAVVLHIDAAFAGSFADWLGTRSGRTVRLAAEGEALADCDGVVLLAPPHHHMTFVHGRARMVKGEPRHHCRPSIDVLFESIALAKGARTLAVLLTGMGRDGAQGLLAIRNAGGVTIAQDEATSVVYGMPREAAILGAAEHILAIGEIGPAITALTKP